MTPYYSDEWLSIYEGDCRDVLRELSAASVDCVVTSPPYWGLRDYGVTGQLGLERTPEEYVANMVAVFAEVRRVLKPSGTCWLNLGDSYNAYNGGAGPSSSISAGASTTERPRLETGFGLRTKGLKPKDLVGIPWRVAFALQADGWYLRSDIIWSKPNPMPESVTDRPTKSHEYLFLLTKSARYYFDADAVRERAIEGTDLGLLRGRSHDGPNADGKRVAWHAPSIGKRQAEGIDSRNGNPSGQRNIRSVWTIATRPYPGAHFAVFPPELPERCIKAGSSEKGVCPECGAPWERVVELGRVVSTGGGPGRATSGSVLQDRGDYNSGKFTEREHVTAGWRPTCAHACALDERGGCIDPRPCYHKPLAPESVSTDPIPAVVLDPFGGSGTVGMVANRLSRRAILIDLNPEYLRQQMQRNAQTPLGLDAA